MKEFPDYNKNGGADGSFEDDQGLSQDESETKNYQEQYYEDLMEQMQFSEDEEEDEEGKGNKSSARPKPVSKENKASKKNDVNQNGYFDFIQKKYPPQIARYKQKWFDDGEYNHQAIPVTGKSDIYRKDRDDNEEEEEMPAIFEPIFSLRQRQQSAKKKRKMRKDMEQKEYSLD